MSDRKITQKLLVFIKMKLQEELESGTSRLEHPARKKLSRPDNWLVMDMCNKHNQGQRLR